MSVSISTKTIDTVMELLSLPENSACADCDGPSPNWASVDKGVFLCATCAGIHRSLGSEIPSKVISFKLDKFSLEDVMKMKDAVSNEYMNSNLYEAAVQAAIHKPSAESSREERTEYIRRKYVAKAFYPTDGYQSSKTAISHAMSHANSQRPKNLIIVRVVSCKNLINTDLIGKSDPYVEVILGEKTQHTRVERNNLSPHFDETFVFPWNNYDKVKINVFDSDRFKQDDFLGWTWVDLNSLSLENHTPLFADFRLQGVPHGSIQIEFTMQGVGH